MELFVVRYCSTIDDWHSYYILCTFEASVRPLSSYTAGYRLRIFVAAIGLLNV